MQCSKVSEKNTQNLRFPRVNGILGKKLLGGEMSYIDYKRKIELSIPQYKEIDSYCKQKQITWFASCWDEQSVEQLAEINISCFKIASRFTYGFQNNK